MQCSQKVGQKKWSHNSSQKTSRTSTPTPPPLKGLSNGAANTRALSCSNRKCLPCSNKKDLSFEQERSPLTEIFFGRKLFRPKLFSANKFFSRKKKRPKRFRPKKLSTEKIFERQRIRPNCFWTKNFSTEKMFGQGRSLLFEQERSLLFEQERSLLWEVIGRPH